MKIALGGILILLGAFSLLTLNFFVGLFLVVFGGIAAGLGLWTITVLQSIASEARTAENLQQVGPQ